MPTPEFKSGQWLTRYALSCGYMELYESHWGHSLSLTDSVTCFRVNLYGHGLSKNQPDGPITGEGPMIDEYHRTLGDARNRFAAIRRALSQPIMREIPCLSSEELSKLCAPSTRTTPGLTRRLTSL